MSRPLPAVFSLTLAALCPALHASDPALEITVIARDGDVVPGVGTITGIQGLAVNDLGQTLVTVYTDHADTSADEVVLLDGVLHLREGEPLISPPGAAIGSFGSLHLDANGDTGWNLGLDGTAGTQDDAGVYWNTSLLVQEGDPVSAPGVTPGSVFTRFWGTAQSGAGPLLVSASIDDPLIAGTLNPLLLQLDPTTGVETAVAFGGMPAPGVPGTTILAIGDNQESYDRNDAGDVMFSALVDPTYEGVVYRNGAVWAMEGAPSPVDGRSWSQVMGSPVSLNNDGDAVLLGQLDGDYWTSYVITRNGEKLYQMGDTLPAFAPHALESLGAGAGAVVADRGEAADTDPDVLWYGDWNGDVSQDSGLFLNEKLLLQEGADSVDGLPVQFIYAVSSTHRMSEDGRYVVAYVRLEGNVDTAVKIDRGPWRSTGGSLAGAQGAPRLRGYGQNAVNAPFTLELDGALPNSTGVLVIGFSRVDQQLLGGTLVPSPDVLLFDMPTDADGGLRFTSTWPAGIPAGVQVYLQHWIADPAAPGGFSASNGVEATAQ